MRAWERWVRDNGLAHFSRRENRFVVVVSRDGTSSVTDQVLDELDLTLDSVIQLAEPGGL